MLTRRCEPTPQAGYPGRRCASARNDVLIRSPRGSADVGSWHFASRSVVAPLYPGKAFAKLYGLSGVEPRVLLLPWPTPATAHGWYPRECCNDLDCAPVDTTSPSASLNAPVHPGAPTLVVRDLASVAIYSKCRAGRRPKVLRLSCELLSRAWDNSGTTEVAAVESRHLSYVTLIPR